MTENVMLTMILVLMCSLLSEDVMVLSRMSVCQLLGREGVNHVMIINPHLTRLDGANYLK